jgi:hypothetical protein
MRPTAYRRNARGLRDRQAFEGVRMQAGALSNGGDQVPVASIACSISFTKRAA